MPKLAAIDRFRSEFRRWVAAHNEAKGFSINPDALLDLLEHRLGQDSLAQEACHRGGLVARQALAARNRLSGRQLTGRPG